MSSMRVAMGTAQAQCFPDSSTGNDLAGVKGHGAEDVNSVQPRILQRLLKPLVAVLYAVPIRHGVPPRIFIRFHHHHAPRAGWLK